VPLTFVYCGAWIHWEALTGNDAGRPPRDDILEHFKGVDEVKPCGFRQPRLGFGKGRWASFRGLAIRSLEEAGKHFNAVPLWISDQNRSVYSNFYRHTLLPWTLLVPSRPTHIHIDIITLFDSVGRIVTVLHPTTPTIHVAYSLTTFLHLTHSSWRYRDLSPPTSLYIPFGASSSSSAEFRRLHIHGLYHNGI